MHVGQHTLSSTGLRAIFRPQSCRTLMTERDMTSASSFAVPIEFCEQGQGALQLQRCTKEAWHTQWDWSRKTQSDDGTCFVLHARCRPRSCRPLTTKREMTSSSSFDVPVKFREQRQGTLQLQRLHKRSILRYTQPDYGRRSEPHAPRRPRSCRPLKTGHDITSSSSYNVPWRARSKRTSTAAPSQKEHSTLIGGAE